MSATEPAEAGTVPRADATVPLRWPPPGLEKLHGAVWRAVTPLAAAALVLTAPMLFAVAHDTPFWSTGPWGSAWWIILALTLLGALLAIGGIARVIETLRDSGRALLRGHNPRIVALIVTDGSNDSGFLLQGLRQYAGLDAGERRVLMAARIIAAVCYTAALLWAAIGLAAGLFLAARGIIGSGRGLVLFVILPAVLLLTPALAARVLESAGTRRLQRQYRRDADAERALRGEVGAWNDAAEERLAVRPRTASPLVVRAAAIALIIAAVLLPLPVLSVAVASSIGTALADIAVPRYGRTAARHARTLLLAPYALPPDPSITPYEAGEILHVISTTGGRVVSEMEVQSVRVLPPLPRDGANIDNMARFAGNAFQRVEPLTAAEIELLERAETHPVHAEFARLARAGAADVSGARLDLAAVTTAQPWSIPIPRFGMLREVAQHRVAQAVLHAHRGEYAQAELALREVISVGVLLSRDGVTLIESLIGDVIASMGATALQMFYASMGRTEDEAPLRVMRETFDAIERANAAAGVTSLSDLEQLMELASRDDVARGMRWEALTMLQVASPCLNPHSTVFGRGEDYARWMAKMREDLVRYPSDDSIFKSIANSVVPGDRGSIADRALGLTLGSTATQGCTAVITELRRLGM